MKSRMLVLSSPKSYGKESFPVQEECCIASSKTPFLQSHILNAIQTFLNRGYEVNYADLSLEGDIDNMDLSEYDKIYIVVSYNIGNLQFPYIDKLLEKYDNVILGANPYQYLDYIRNRFDKAKDVIPVHEMFQTDYEQPLHVIPKRYFQHYKSAFYQLSSGCFHRCGFCVWHNRYKIKNPEIAVNDLMNIHNIFSEYGWTNNPRGTMLTVLTNQMTNKDKTWLRRFAEVKEDKIKDVTFSVNINCHYADEENVELLRRCNIKTAVFGAESLSPAVLKKINKPHTVEEVYDTIRLLNTAGININLHLRTDMGETDEDIEITKNYLVSWIKEGLKIFQVNFGRIVYWDGTLLAKQTDKNIINYNKSNWGVPWPSRKDLGVHDNLYEEFISDLKELKVNVRWSKY